MARYLAGRLVRTIVTLWLIATLTFVLMHAVPGGPFDREKPLPPAIKANLERKYNLDLPIWQQYLLHLRNVAVWDLGPSMAYEARAVNEIIAEGFPVSALFGGLAMLVAVVLGIGLGVVAGIRQHRWEDHAAMFFATAGFAVPNFVLGTVLVYLFAYRWKLVPLVWEGDWPSPVQLVLPVVALATLPTAFIARLVRSSMVEVLSQDYIRMAWAKGLPGRIVVYRHALRNALLPVITYLGPLAAGILTGSFVIEQIFAIPGLGKQFVLSVANRDYTLIMGTTMFYSFLLVLANFVVDLAYALVDPRIKLAGGRD